MASALIYGHGLIANKLVRTLRDHNIDVYLLSNSSEYVPNTTHIRKDIFSLRRKDLPTVQTVYFIPQPYHGSNIQHRKFYIHALTHLLSLVSQHTKIVYKSSHKVYGNRFGQQTTESSPISFSSDIQKSIRDGEKILEHSPNPFVIVRSADIYQPEQLKQRIANLKISYSHRIHYTNLIHVVDLCNAMHFLSNHVGIFNVSDQASTPLNVIISCLSSKYGLHTPQAKQSLSLAKGVKLSCSKLLALGFKLKYHSVFLSNTHQAKESEDSNIVASNLNLRNDELVFVYNIDFPYKHLANQGILYLQDNDISLKLCSMYLGVDAFLCVM